MTMTILVMMTKMIKMLYNHCEIDYGYGDGNEVWYNWEFDSIWFQAQIKCLSHLQQPLFFNENDDWLCKCRCGSGHVSWGPLEDQRDWSVYDERAWIVQPYPQRRMPASFEFSIKLFVCLNNSSGGLSGYELKNQRRHQIACITPTH